MNKLISLIFLLLIFVSGCKKEKDIPLENDEDMIVFETIGSEGGILETEDFILKVPAESFSEDTEIGLKVKPAYEHLTEIAATPMYILAGLPNEFQKPISVSIRHSGNLSGTNFIALAKEDSVHLIDTSFVDLAYDLHDATESDGFLTSTIETIQFTGEGLKKGYFDDPDVLNIVGFTLGKTGPVGENFYLEGAYPSVYQKKVNWIIERCEQAYKRFKDAGFDYSGIENQPIHLKIILGKKKSYIKLGPMNSIAPELQLHLINPDAADIKEENIVASMLVTMLISSSNEFYKNRSQALPYAIWILFHIDPTKYKEKKYLEVFLSSSNYSSLVRWGSYGGYLLDYIWNYHGGDQKIAQISKVNKSIYPAVADVMGEPSQTNWLQKFYEYLILEEFDSYSNLEIEDLSVETFLIDNSKTKWDHLSYHAIQSAKIYSIRPVPPISENTKLKFKTDSKKAGISIIKYRSSKEREFVTRGQSELIVSGIKDLSEDGYYLFALVANNNSDPTSGITEIPISIEKTEDIQLTGCSVVLSFLSGDYTETYPNDGGSKTLTDQSLGLGFPKEKPDSDFSFTGNTLTQKYKDYLKADGYYYSSEIIIKFGTGSDGTTDWSYISSLSAKWKRAKDLNYTKNLDENELSAINIPLDNTVSYLRYRLSGESVCNQLQNLYNKISRDTWTQVLQNQSWKCTKESELVIYLSQQ